MLNVALSQALNKAQPFRAAAKNTPTVAQGPEQSFSSARKVSNTKLLDPIEPWDFKMSTDDLIGKMNNPLQKVLFRMWGQDPSNEEAFSVARNSWLA